MPAIASLPNLLTLSRLALAPFVAWALVSHRFSLAVGLLMVACATDFLDGLAARGRHEQSKLGERLDPIADKTLLVVVYLALGAANLFPWWLVALVLGRDAGILAVAGVLMLTTPIRQFPPTIWGKISTTMQMLGALVVILARLEPLAWLRAIEPLAVPSVAIATAWSWAHYGYLGVRMLRAGAAGSSRTPHVDGGQAEG